jgi:hypothetical protein
MNPSQFNEIRPCRCNARALDEARFCCVCTKQSISHVSNSPLISMAIIMSQTLAITDILRCKLHQLIQKCFSLPRYLAGVFLIPTRARNM